MKRALLLVVPLALAFGACGDDDDEPDVTAADVTAPDVSIPEITMPDLSIPDFTMPDLSIPDFTIPDLSIPDFTIPDLSIPENAAELLGQMFPQLDDEQIDCLVEAADEVGGEVTDPSALFDYLAECNVDPSDFVGGG